MKLLLILPLLFLAACSTSRPCLSPQNLTNEVNFNTLIDDFSILSSDAMQGRLVGTLGGIKAREYIKSQFINSGVAPFKGRFVHSFAYKQANAANVIGLVKGVKFPNQYIVVTAHYDHLGIKKSKIFNGADDNASGVAALLTIAKQVSKEPLNYSMLFLATDAEEQGLKGAKAFIKENQNLVKHLVLNINLDMISQDNGKHRLYLAGTNTSPILNAIEGHLISRASVCLKKGHNYSSRSGRQTSKKINWRNASDHAVFRRNNIPYLYFGVNVHPRYHTPNDNFMSINQQFYYHAVDTIFYAIKHVNEQIL